MTLPRRILPGRTYAITRRTERRTLLLRPDDRFNQLFLWVLAVTANKLGIEVHAVCCMSTHFHLVVTAREANVSELMERLDFRLAKAIQVLRRFVQGVVWAPGALSIVELTTERAVVEAIAYAMCNPVAAALVHRPEDWPGVTTLLEELDGLGRVGRRPDVYFAQDDAKWAPTATLRFVLPASLRERGREAGIERIRVELERQVAEARAHCKANGWKVLGAVAVRARSPYSRATSWEAFGELRPHVAAGRGQTEARCEAIALLKAFRAAYRAALAKWCAGEREVVFPAGTYKMRRLHGVHVALPT
ncbi:MAG: transposase [Sandaracinaceae bacterium]